MANMALYLTALIMVFLLPGPDMILLLQTGARQGRALALTTALGLALNENIEALHASGEIAEILGSFGLDKQAADVGAPRLVE